MGELEEKGACILEWVVEYSEKRTEMDRNIRKLMRIAKHYVRGIDPKDIKSRILPPDGIATITMKDGTVHAVPVREVNDG